MFEIVVMLKVSGVTSDGKARLLCNCMASSYCIFMQQKMHLGFNS